MTKKEHMWKLQTIRHALQDANLYLDTHPTSKLALDYYNMMQKEFDKEKKEYEKSYGPITINDGKKTFNNWQWVKGPWPWQREV